MSFSKSLAAAALIAAIASSSAPARAQVFRNWASAVSGTVSDPARWNPSGVPTSLDQLYIDVAGGYTVTFDAGAPATTSINTNGGSSIWNLTSPHTTGSLWVANAASPSIQSGILTTRYLELGNGGSPTLTLTRQSVFGPAGWLQSAGDSHPAGNGDEVGAFTPGVATLNVFGGGRFETGVGTAAPWGLVIAHAANMTGVVNVAGSFSQPFTYSRLRAVGAAPIKVGFVGNGTLHVNNGGICETENDVIVAEVTGAVGLLRVGNTGTAIGTPTLNVGRNLGIGRGFFSVAAGSATMEVFNPAFVRVAGRTDVGSTGGDQGCVLRLFQGARFVASGGLSVQPTPGAGLDLRGGVLHVHGGAFTYPPNRLLTVSSRVGTPELWIANGVANTGPTNSAFVSQLFVGRGGTGTLRVTGSGTRLNLGNGSTLVGDSLGGVGTVVVDSAGVLASGGTIAIGTNGFGTLDVRGGGSAFFTAMFLGAAPTGNGNVYVTGAGSLVQAVQDLYVGGGLGGDASNGSVVVDSGGTFRMISNGGVNPPLARVFPTAGEIAVANGGQFVSPGSIQNEGRVNLNGGLLDVLSLSQFPSGRLSGWGEIRGALNSNGRLEPFSSTSPFGRLHFANAARAFSQFSAGRYGADLGAHAGRQCDTVSIAGTANLAGTLALRTDPSFTFVPGDTFTVMTYGARVGTFENVTWNGVPLGGRAQIVYGPNAVWVILSSTVSVEPGAGPAPDALRLSAMTGSPRLELAMPVPAHARVRLYDVSGRVVATLVDAALPAGRHVLRADDAGLGSRSGVYFARAEIAGGRVTRVLTAKLTVRR